jgi:L-alanine-DL-glutamate epimerase-like enolase superfamily enzyme
VAVIQRVEAFQHTWAVDPPLYHGSGVTRALSDITVRITDSDGVAGYGECDVIPAVMGMLEAMARDLIGQDPMPREAILGRLRAWYTSSFAVSAMSVALDDLVGKRLGVSVASLYGGPVRTRVQPYAASYGAPEGRFAASWVEEAASLVERGFPAMKLRLGGQVVADDCAALLEVRGKAPASLALLGDGNGGFNQTTARVMGRCAEEAGLVWFEEPLPMEGYVGYPELAADLVVPLAGGELSQSRPAAFSLLERRGVDVIQPDPLICGGIGETVFIGALARQFGRVCVPHTSGSAIGVTAGLHALACLPDQSLRGKNELMYLEYPALINPVQEAIAPTFVKPVDGWITLPPGPGLGLVIDDAAVEGQAVAKFTVN